MRLFAAQSADAHYAERRATTRHAVDCEARLLLASGYRSGRMLNISTEGVRLQMGNPPQPGQTVLLQWRGHEAFCKVIWANGDACGINFEKALSRALLLDTTGEVDDTPPAPVAHHGNIQMGQKRSLRRAGE